METEINKGLRMRTRQCKAGIIEDQSRKDQDLREQITGKYKHLKGEMYEVLPADMFSPNDQEMIRKVLLDCHNAR